MIRYQGDEARAEITKYIEKYGANVYQMDKVDEDVVRDYLESQFNQSDKLPDSGSKMNDSRAHDIDNYDILENNCTTKSCDAIQEGNNRQPITYTKEMKNPKMAGGKGMVKMTINSISPSSLDTQLSDASKDSNSGVQNVTNEYR